MAELNDNMYSSLANFKSEYAHGYLIRLGSREDEEPLDFNSDINDRLTKALKAASDKMDGYIMAKHSTPVSPAPDFFEEDCQCIAIGILTKKKGYMPDTQDDNAVKDAKECEKKYEGIAKGTWDFSIPDDGGESAPITRTKAGAPDRLFTSDLLDGYNKAP